jgi:putative tryptophan/tyrosine transport system ATP-binding protein
VSAAALSLQGVRKTFAPGTPNPVRALQGVDLEVTPGSFVVVIGTNGSGKSSLLGAIAGSFPVDAGTVHIGGRDVTRWAEHRRAGLAGRVFQDPFAGTAPELTVAENLALAAGRGRRRGLGWLLGARLRRELAERVRELGMGLEGRLEQTIGSLSGGQRQALTLLMATWRAPELLLLDEHTAALDPKSADQIVRVSEAVIARERLTALMVTHSMQQAVGLGDRLLMLDRGRILHDLGGAEKSRLRVDDLLARFEEVRRGERLDESAAEVLRRGYV